MGVALLKSQDVLLLCKLLVQKKEGKVRQLDLSQDLGITQSEVSTGFDRLIKSRLIDPNTKKPNLAMAFEFLENSVKFFFPAETTEYTVGIPTSVFAKPLANLLLQKGESLVWPTIKGNKKGIGLKPIHESVPFATNLDPKLYELLAVLDALRSFKAGRVKEQSAFALRKIIFGDKDE